MILAATAFYTLSLTYDLAFFLPKPKNDAQQLLVERLGQGPSSQLIFVVLPDTSLASAKELADSLRSLPSLRQVLPEAHEINLDLIPDVLWRNRLLLTNQLVSEIAWLEVLDARTADLMIANDKSTRQLMAADPTLSSVNALTEFIASAHEPIFTNGKDQYLLLRTNAPAFDIDAQAQALQELKLHLHNTGHSNAHLYGSGVYGVNLQSSIQRESTIFSTLAGLALALLIFWRFRSLTKLIAVALPLLAGGAAGLCALALLYAKVHGITIAFGFTLLGITIDYPLHLFSNENGLLKEKVWPTLLLGIISTMIAYAAFIFGGTKGLEQLGVFAVVGIAVAALSAAWLGNVLNKHENTQSIAASGLAPLGLRCKLNYIPSVVCLLVTLPMLCIGPIFSNDLSTLTPIPKATLAEEAKLRQRMGVSDMRYLVAVRANELEDVLTATESTTEVLNHAIQNGELISFQSVTQILPSRARQSERRNAIQQLLKQDSFQRAVANSQFSQNAFKPFEDDMRKEKMREDWLEIDDFKSEPELYELISNMLYPSQEQWVSLIFLHDMDSSDLLAKRLGASTAAQLVDLKSASMQLVEEYRAKVFKVLAVAFLLIALLLWLRMRDLRLVVWLLMTLTAAVAFAALGSMLIQTSLSLLDLMALALVAGLGLDYSLFYSRIMDKNKNAVSTASAVFICAASSILVFGILSLSSIPLLKGIGITVSLGVLAAYLLARFGRYAYPTA